MLVSKRKRYLSGSDWVINCLDRMMKNATNAGNMSQIVLVLAAPVDEHELRERLNGFVKSFPVLQGRVSRDLKLAPYWKIPKHAVNDPLLAVHRMDQSPADGSIVSLLERSANAPFRGPEDHLAFQVITDTERSIVSMTFDHRIFDARGAELFLDLFQQSLQSSALPIDGVIPFASSSALTQWSKKFLAGRNVNRRIIALAKASEPEGLPVPTGTDRGFRYRLLSFSPQETVGIYDRAYQEAGYLMESPFLLSVILQSLQELFRSRKGTASSYLIPVTMDLRPGKDQLQEIFFNYVSYLFYQVPVRSIAGRAGLIALLKEQMYELVKSGFPRDLAEASLLTRIAPLPVLGKLLKLPMKGKMATCAFSHLGKSAYRSSEFMGAKIDNLYHMPRVPAPPGLGFFSNYFNGRLNLVISFIDGLLEDKELSMIEQGIRARFLTGSD